MMPARRRIASWILAAVLAVGAAATHAAVPQGPAGTTVETAIVLPRIADEFHGVAAEHAYIAKNFPTWHIEYQATTQQNGRRYDLLGMVRPDGGKTTLFFDITDWFGK